MFKRRGSEIYRDSRIVHRLELHALFEMVCRPLPGLCDSMQSLDMIVMSVSEKNSVDIPHPNSPKLLGEIRTGIKYKRAVCCLD
jgi:hypothetical protein